MTAREDLRAAPAVFIFSETASMAVPRKLPTRQLDRTVLRPMVSNIETTMPCISIPSRRSCDTVKGKATYFSSTQRGRVVGLCKVGVMLVGFRRLD
jgi:hypothetical protein